MKNWKTTLFGIVAALGLFTQALPKGDEPVKPTEIISAIAVAALGLTSKDHDVTGGSKSQ